ncbi:MAG: DUF4091 domain-containing protein [Acidobacteria bacterium]|nr:DUF4091 domain-containing protein [Acidobacteriota bacterium]
MRVLGALLALGLLSQNFVLARQPARVWAVGDGEKVERDDLRNRNRASNSAWDGRRIKVFGARNEVIAFQVVVEAGAGGIGALSVALPELRRRGGGASIRYARPAADPTVYIGRPIQLFSVNYMNVTETTRANWVWRPGSPAAPADTKGWKPVQLVPENAKAGRGGFPLTVAPNQNQAVWVEIYTARDLPAGVYEGRVEVTADGRRRTLPVEMELFDFTLPDENSMHAMVYYEPTQPQQYQGRDLDREYHRFAHRHRVELVHAYNVASARAARGRFTGEDFTRARGYEGPGERVGNRVIPRSFYGPGKDFDERESAWRHSDEWMTFLRENFPAALTFLYVPDEPGPSEYDYIRRLGDNVHSNPGPGKALPLLVTKRYTKELEDAIDIWDSGPLGFEVERARTERARGRKYWIYNGGRPAAGAIVIDAPATDSRATIWACFKHDVEVYFYWHGVHWKHNGQKQGVREQNVWANPITFDNRGQPRKPVDSQGWINGDGVLMYPGEDRLHPSEDRGVPGPVSTVQLANFRRGLQDHQYLTLARRLGLKAEVEAGLRAVVPRVFSEVPRGGAVAFAETGDAFESVRYRLARAIARAERDDSPRPRPSRGKRRGH